MKIMLNPHLILLQGINEHLLFPNDEECERYIKGHASTRVYVTELQAQRVQREFFLYRFDEVLEELPYLDRLSCFKKLWWKFKQIMR